MYGLLLEGIADAVRKKFGEEVWQEVRKKAGVPHHSFVMHKTYSETVIPRLVKATSEVTGRPIDELMELCGLSFVGYISQYGYDRVMRVLGRHLRDFLSGLDNLHEYLRFSYPKLKPPSFFCENESRSGLTLHYRSKRRGFIYYMMGQITQVAKQFYNAPLEIEIISEEETLDMTHVVLRLHFDNTAYKDPNEEKASEDDSMQVSSTLFFDVFPFHIVFTKNMVIRSVGSGLSAVMDNLIGQAVDEMFSLIRPLVEFTMENVLMHTNNVFEMTSVDPVKKNRSTESTGMDTLDEDDPDDKRRRLRMKGQMLYMEEWDAVMFLGTPIMENLDKMFETGLFINDLSMHDSSRDLVLAGTQQQAELKMALDQEQQKSKKLEDSMRKLDVERKRTDALLYQMIPKAVADRLRSGESTTNTCQTFDEVSVLFSDVVGFTRICSQISPMQVVTMLNAMYTKFDKLSEKHHVYKVETIGDAYMVVSGAPIVTNYHAIYVCDMALDMLESVKSSPDPSIGPQSHLKIRVGCHTGPVVAGVMGVKMPRYCFFGETVNVANKMESNGQAMRVLISETTYNDVKTYPLDIEAAGEVEIQGGTVPSYWVNGKTGEAASKGKSVSDAVQDKADLDGMFPGFINTDGDEPDLGNMYKPVVERVSSADRNSWRSEITKTKRKKHTAARVSRLNATEDAVGTGHYLTKPGIAAVKPLKPLKPFVYQPIEKVTEVAFNASDIIKNTSHTTEMEIASVKLAKPAADNIIKPFNNLNNLNENTMATVKPLTYLSEADLKDSTNDGNIFHDGTAFEEYDPEALEFSDDLNEHKDVSFVTADVCSLEGDSLLTDPGVNEGPAQSANNDVGNVQMVEAPQRQRALAVNLTQCHSTLCDIL